EESLANLDRSTPTEQRSELPALTQLLTLRRAEDVASRELLLRELAAIMRQETDARKIVIRERGEDNHRRDGIAHGCTPDDVSRLVEEMEQVKSDDERLSYAKRRDASLTLLRSTNAPPAILYMSPRELAMMPGSVSIEPLLRIVELGMDVCAL